MLAHHKAKSFGNLHSHSFFASSP